MFAPYTAGSALTKELREAENKLGDSTGIKVKIVERCGTKIVDILTSSDPWKGQACLRAGCLLCQTKSYTGKHLSQDCRKRSVVYETRCITCEERKIKEIKEKFENEEDEKVKMENFLKIKIFKYMGETSKSCYERGWQHLSDATQLKPSSHILKHYLDNLDEELEDIKFGMRIRSTARNAFERQVAESVLIQQESNNHNILNSKSEYNRCALPRLTTKLGEKFEKWKKEELEDKKKEEDLEKKIRTLRKERNKKRDVHINVQHLPPMERRKTGEEKYMSIRQLLEWKKEERDENIKVNDNDRIKKKRKKEKEYFKEDAD